MSDSVLDIERPEELRAYLRSTGRIEPGEPVEVRCLAGGVSNRTVLVTRGSGEAWVVKQALERLRVKADWFSDPRRIHREAAGLRTLARIAPAGAIPPLIFEDHEQHLLAMAAVPSPHENLKAVLLAGRVEPDHVRQFARLLAVIHRRGHEERHTLATEFADRGFFESLRLRPYYESAAGRVPGAAPFLDRLAGDCRARRFTLVHGDYSPKNVLVRAGRLVLLDHEVIHFGDGAFDVGFALTHLLSKAHHVRSCRAVLADAARLFWAIYDQATAGCEWRAGFEPVAVRHTLACLLARVAGRSPLEYLDGGEQARQSRVVLELMDAPPAVVPDLVDRFTALLGGTDHAHH
jgi:aminoglycoside phosphotransferase (APT) family kinase protein